MGKEQSRPAGIYLYRFYDYPIALTFLFTYFPFAEMIKFSFYKMKYTTPIDRREFVGWDNYLNVFRREDCFGALKLSLFYMVGALIQLVLALYLATILSFKVKGGNLFKGLMFSLTSSVVLPLVLSLNSSSPEDSYLIQSCSGVGFN